MERSSACVNVVLEPGSHTAGSPCLCFLLQLQEHISAVIIVLKEVYVVDDQHEWLAALSSTAECDFLKFV